MHKLSLALLPLMLVACWRSKDTAQPHGDGMATLRARACACKDATCATAVNDDYTKYRDGAIVTKPKSDDVVAYEKCWTRAMGDTIIGQVTELKAKACACHDTPCATQVQKDFATWGYALAASVGGDPEVDDALEPRIDAEVFDYRVCLDGALGVEGGVARMVEFKSEMCACTDQRCATKVNDSLARWSAAFATHLRAEHEIDETVSKRMTDAAAAYGACMAKLAN